MLRQPPGTGGILTPHIPPKAICQIPYRTLCSQQPQNWLGPRGWQRPSLGGNQTKFKALNKSPLQPEPQFSHWQIGGDNIFLTRLWFEETKPALAEQVLTSSVYQPQNLAPYVLRTSFHSSPQQASVVGARVSSLDRYPYSWAFASGSLHDRKAQRGKATCLRPHSWEIVKRKVMPDLQKHLADAASPRASSVK